jgi:hypothetical protein
MIDIMLSILADPSMYRPNILRFNGHKLMSLISLYVQVFIVLVSARGNKTRYCLPVAILTMFFPAGTVSLKAVVEFGTRTILDGVTCAYTVE